MDFEWDPVKPAGNARKHGVSFEEARELWNDPCAIKIPLGYTDEQRYLVSGLFRGKHWTAICTDRNGRVRIISFRRAHKKEEELYEES